MFYFINEYILQKNSSVEHTAINRVKLFTHYKQPAKIVTKIYDRLLHRTITDFSLTDEQVINMFDYFQEATDLKQSVFLKADDIHLPIDYEISVGANYSQVSNGDTLVENVGFIPGTIGRVFYQEFFDSQGNRIETDLWDWRGFKSATQYFGQNGKLIMQRYYTPTGKNVLEEYYAPDTQSNPLLSRVILKNYHGEGDRFFQNSDDLFVFFLKELSKQAEGTTTFISDRPGTGVKPLLALDDASRKYVYIPINHAVNPNDPVHADLDGFLQPAFEHFKHFDGFITATVQQAEHLSVRYPTANIFAMPTATTLPLSKETDDQVTPNQRKRHSLLYVGRIAQDKRIDQLLRMFSLVKDRVPAATFTLFGYGDPKYLEDMQKLITELNLEHNVTLNDYTPGIESEYDHYQVLVNMAFADGGPVAMAEAMMHGLPVVSYRFNYGPAEYIDEGVNGYLIDSGQSLAMAEKIVDLFNDDKLLADFSKAAYTSAHTRWTRRKVWNRWQRNLKTSF
ncbi:Glycosyltransferase [Levilactobacillus brevis]|uniref:accessory Sec system glycosyltransferase Asp1 n=1 Tax=Levilactobacillus brevis TaxID=1580 RepID=UPI000B3574B4|nr:accessory Sec system glycosyltransferase Asp1 [Levilactobacillus brevis]QCZ48605.1 Glycosyltransferase [Levilactobacillus brevis]